jgi:hypothetical protein
MSRTTSFQPRFVEYIPRELEAGVLYISDRFKTASHLCACGCGERVVTPLTPADWKLKVAAGKVSLFPSIGNWNYACKSHYWIKNNEVVWAGALSGAQIARVQRQDLADKQAYIREQNIRKSSHHVAPSKDRSQGVLHKIKKLFGL